jgi:hypothetical protein
MHQTSVTRRTLPRATASSAPAATTEPALGPPALAASSRPAASRALTPGRDNRLFRDLDEKIRASMVEYGIPGVAVVVLYHEADDVNGYAMTNVDHPVPVDGRHRLAYRIHYHEVHRYQVPARLTHLGSAGGGSGWRPPTAQPHRRHLPAARADPAGSDRLQQRRSGAGRPLPPTSGRRCRRSRPGGVRADRRRRPTRGHGRRRCRAAPGRLPPRPRARPWQRGDATHTRASFLPPRRRRCELRTPRRPACTAPAGGCVEPVGWQAAVRRSSAVADRHPQLVADVTASPYPDAVTPGSRRSTAGWAARRLAPARPTSAPGQSPAIT